MLLAAAVTRQLHDTGRTGAWGLAPLPFGAFGIWMQPQVFARLGSAPLNFELLFAVYVGNVLYLAAIGLVLYRLFGEPTPSDNRFGPPVSEIDSP